LLSEPDTNSSDNDICCLDDIVAMFELSFQMGSSGEKT
jgi:hypothetical protein